MKSFEGDILEHPALKYFPHDSFRENQRETILEIVNHFENGIENVCLEMPTGGGKSAIAFTIARWIAEKMVYQSEPQTAELDYITPSINGKSYIITPQKILQDQYGKDIDNLILHEEMTLLKGKGNYPCKLNEGKKCDDCVLQIGRKCSLKDECLYYRTEKHSIEAQTAILNYHMLHTLDSKLYKKCYSEELGAIDTDKYEREYKRDLIIIDEAHNTESFLMDLISVSIRLNDEKDQRWYMSNPAKVPEVKELLQVSIDGLYQMVSDIKYQIENSKDDNILKLGKRLATISRKIQKLEYLQLTIENGNWAFVRDIRVNQDTNKKYAHAIECKPVFVSSFARAMIFRCARLKLFISATLPDKDVFCRSLGLNADATAYIKLPNTFPIENRKIYYMPRNKSMTLNAANFAAQGNALYDNVLNVIDNIINWEFHRNQKGLIITHTNAFMNLICNCIDSREFIQCSGSIESDTTDEQKDMRLDAITRHCKGSSNSILIGPNLYEGLNLTGDLARFVIMVKCPYPFEDEQVRARREKDSQWYYNGVGIKIIQGLGRGMRSKDDWVMNYLIDPGFDQFIGGRGGRFIPRYITQAMEPMPSIFTAIPDDDFQSGPDLPF